MIKKLINKIDDKVLKWIVLSIFFLQPLLELDYLLVDFLGNIPRPSTIFRVIFIPIIVLLVFIKKETNKKKVGILFASYLVVLGIYFVIHSKNCVAIYESLYLTTNFYFDLFKEFIYVYTSVIPYFIIYALYKSDVEEGLVCKILLIDSLVLSILIILGDIFLFGLSTYSESNTVASIFSWLNNDPYVISPRELSSKFFFPEGNTLGIYLFGILPILYASLAYAKKTKEKVINALAILLQSIAMFIVSTRVGTYGALLMPIVAICLYIIFIIMKKVEKSFVFVGVCVLVFGLLLMLFPVSPAYVNGQIEHENDVAVLNDNYLLDEAKNGLNAKDLVPGSAEYNFYYMHYFEDWGIKTNLISSVSKEYYLYFYNYKFDAKFWWDVLDLYPLEERCNGRQIQTIFENYKWNSQGSKTHLLGMGYTTFMNGSFILEQDFVQQKYSFGYLGCGLLLGPWVAIALYGVYKFFKDFKNNFNMKTMMYIASFVIILGSSIVSGHTLDQYLTTSLLALISFVLLQRVNNSSGE